MTKDLGSSNDATTPCNRQAPFTVVYFSLEVQMVLNYLQFSYIWMMQKTPIEYHPNIVSGKTSQKPNHESVLG